MSAEALRGSAVLGDVLSVDDTGEAQVVMAQTHDGVVRDGIEVMQPHGHASNPSDGGLVLLIAVGGDQGHMVALPLGLPSRRFGNLPAGGSVVYDDSGSRLLFKADGNGMLSLAALFRIAVQSLRIETQAGMEVHGPTVFKDDVTIEGNLTITGNLTLGGDLQVGGSIHAGGSITHG